MNETDFWTNYARAMELSIEGNRLIAHEIADLARSLWQRTIRTLDATVRSEGHRRHLPPV
jgi:hypothetical protein